MDKNVISIIILLLMIVLCIVILILYTRYMRNNIANSSSKGKANDDRLYKTDNVLEFTKWLHKNPTEIGMEERYIRSDGVNMRVNFDGMLFDCPADGYVYFEEDGGEVIKKAKTIYVFCTELSYDECKNKLSRIYGKVKDEGEEPFAEGAGGSIQHCEFSGRGVKVKLSKASEQEIVKITIE